jgi:hypothetical protein
MRQARMGIGTTVLKVMARATRERLSCTLVGILTSLALVVPAFAARTHQTYFLLPPGSWSPRTGLFLHNLAKKSATVTLTAFNERGDLLAQTPVPLGPSENKALFPGESGEQLPRETTAVMVESDKPLVGFTIFGSLEAPLEMLPASGAVSETLDFPHFGQGIDPLTTYFLFNPNAFPAQVTFRAFDKDRALLAEAPVFPFSPQGGRH